MAERTVDEENEIAKAKRLSTIRDRARIFREVLGSPHGKLLIGYLAENFKTGSGFPPNQLDDHGRTDALQTWRKLGHFDVLHYINTQIEWRESDVHPSSERT